MKGKNVFIIIKEKHNIKGVREMNKKNEIMKIIKKETKRNNINCISSNNSSFINTISSGNRFKYRR